MKVCAECGKPGDCLDTNIGPMCRPCFHGAMKKGGHRGIRLYTLPEPDQKVFVVMEKPGVFVTISGNLYAFERRNDAQEIADGLRKSYGIPDAFVEETEARNPWAYVMTHPELNLIGVKEAFPGKPGPDSVTMPRL